MAEDKGLGALLLPTAASSGTDGGQPRAKRICLRHYDQIPHQVLNTMGASGVEHVPLSKLWATMVAGNAVATHLSNLCFEDDERKNIGMSQVMEVLDKALERYKTPEARAVINEGLYASALSELNDLHPSVKILNCGQRNSRSSNVVSSVTHYAVSANDHGVGAIENAARVVYAWLNKSDSKLRAVLLFLSGGGLWYNASVFDKSMRAWCNGKAITEAQFLTVARARTSVPASDDARDSMQPLMTQQ